MNHELLQRLTAFLDGELPPGERLAVEQLLRESEEARRVFRSLESDAARLRALSRVNAPVEISSRVMMRIAQPVRKSVAWRSWHQVAIAAAIVVSVGVGTFAVLQQMSKTNNRGGDLVRVAPDSTGNTAANAKPVNKDGNEAVVAKLPARLPSAKQLSDALDELRAALKPLADGVTGILGSGPDAIAGAFARPNPDGAEGSLTSPYLTSQLHPAKAFKSIELSKLPLFLDLKELEHAKLLARLREDPLHHVDLSCQESWKSLERLQAACKAAGVRLVIDAEVTQRQAKKLPAAYMIYLENISPDVVVKLLQALQAQEADPLKKGDLQFGSIMVSPLDDVGRKRLAESLGVPASSLQPVKKAGPAASVDPTKPLARDTEKALDKLAAGQGTKPAGKEPAAVVLIAVPNRSRVPVSKEVKAHLDSRGGLQAGQIGVVFVLRPSRG